MDVGIDMCMDTCIDMRKDIEYICAMEMSHGHVAWGICMDNVCRHVHRHVYRCQVAERPLAGTSSPWRLEHVCRLVRVCAPRIVMPGIIVMPGGYENVRWHLFRCVHGHARSHLHSDAYIHVGIGTWRRSPDTWPI